MDPAKSRVAFIGFLSSTSLIDRTKALESFIASMPNFKHTACGTFFSGPRNNRVPSKVSFLEFATEDEAMKLLKEAPSTIRTDNGVELKLKPALTKINSKRNWALRRASELIQDTSEARLRSVKINWKDRTVTLDGTAVFLQNKEDLYGSFADPFTYLQIP